MTRTKSEGKRRKEENDRHFVCALTKLLLHRNFKDYYSITWVREKGKSAKVVGMLMLDNPIEASRGDKSTTAGAQKTSSTS